MVAQGEEWLEFRKAVQQDMMRRDSAHYYIEEIDEVLDEVIAIIEERKSADKSVGNLQKFIHQYVLESLSLMLLGTRLGALQGSKEGEQLIKTADDIMNTLVPFTILPDRLNKMTGVYQKLVNGYADFFDICQGKIKEAMAKDAKDGSLKGTVLGNLLERNGKNSKIPAIMATDAMNAGIDTTGKVTKNNFVISLPRTDQGY